METSAESLDRKVVLGVDGGNTKTVALAATTDGSIVGVGAGTCTDMYGGESPGAAVAELERVVHDACAQAGTDPSRLAASVFSLAGADWPEDYEILTRELSVRLGLHDPPVVMNDALGPLHVGTSDGVGVSLVCGTFFAVGARGTSGRVWHTSFWAEPGGAHGLGSMALRAVYRAELGLGPSTSLTARLLALYEVASTEQMLHGFTRLVDPVPDVGVTRAARVLLDEAAEGDAVARDLVAAHAALLCDYILAAARRVGLAGGFVIVLAGGVFNHDAHLLENLLELRLEEKAPAARTVRADLPPVAGAVLHALQSQLGTVSEDIRARLADTMPVPQLQAMLVKEPTFRVNRRHA